MRAVSVFLVALVPALISAATPSGLAFSASSQLLTRVAVATAELANTVLPNHALPPVSGSGSAGMTYTITNLFLSKFAVADPENNVVFAAEQGKTAGKISQIDTVIEFNWQWKRWPLGGKGKGKVTVRSMGISVDVVLGQNATTGAATASCSGAVAVVGEVVSEGLPFDMEVKPEQIVDMAQKGITSFIDTTVNTMLANLRYEVGPVVSLDYRLVSAPVVGEGFIFFPQSGAVTPAKNPDQNPPITAKGIAVTAPPAAADLALFASDYTLTSTLWAYNELGLFKRTITEIDGKPLNTEDFKVAIPAFPAKFPNAAFVVAVTPVGFPTAAVGTAGCQLQGTFALGFDVAGSSQSAFTLGLAISGDLQLSFANATRIVGQIQGKPAMTWSVVNTAIGPIDLTSFTHITAALEVIVVAGINKVMAAGQAFPFKLPAGWSALNPVIAYTPGVVQVSVDIALN